MPMGPFIISAFTAFVAFCKYTERDTRASLNVAVTDSLPLNQQHCLLHPRRFRIIAALSTSALSRVTKNNYKRNKFAFFLQEMLLATHLRIHVHNIYCIQRHNEFKLLRYFSFHRKETR